MKIAFWWLEGSKEHLTVLTSSFLTASVKMENCCSGKIGFRDYDKGSRFKSTLINPSSLKIGCVKWPRSKEDTLVSGSSLQSECSVLFMYNTKCAIIVMEWRDSKKEKEGIDGREAKEIRDESESGRGWKKVRRKNEGEGRELQFSTSSA